MLKKLILLGAAGLMLALSPSIGQAQTFWISNGGGCVAEDPSIQSDLYQTVTGGMRVKFKPNKSATIKLVCPVTTPDISSANTLEIFYQDPDGEGATYRVSAALRSARLSDGAFSTLCTADSNSNPSTAMWSRASCLLRSSLNPDAFSYWVEVLIFRDVTDPTPTVEFNAARLSFVVQ